MDEDICETCGERNVAGAQFCTSCGSYLGWDGAAKPAPSEYAKAEPQRGQDPAADRAGGVHAEQPAPTSVLPVPPVTPITAGYPAPAPAPAPAPSPATPAPAGQDACSRCGTVNEPGRRFCRKCAEPLGRPSTGVTAPVSGAATPPDTASERAARSAYRHSLPMRYRIIRIASAVAVLALVIAFLAAARSDPVGWTRREIYALRGTVVPVQGLTAVSQGPVAPGGPAANAVDQNANTSWAIPMRPPGTAGPTCGASPSAMLITISGTQPVTIRALEVTPGLVANDPNWQLKWVPLELELQAAGKSCQRVALKNAQGPQRVKVKPITTNVLRVSIVAAAQPPPGGTNIAAITEIQLLKRPG